MGYGPNDRRYEQGKKRLSKTKKIRTRTGQSKARQDEDIRAPVFIYFSVLAADENEENPRIVTEMQTKLNSKKIGFKQGGNNITGRRQGQRNKHKSKYKTVEQG